MPLSSAAVKSDSMPIAFRTVLIQILIIFNYRNFSCSCFFLENFNGVCVAFMRCFIPRKSAGFFPLRRFLTNLSERYLRVTWTEYPNHRPASCCTSFCIFKLHSHTFTHCWKALNRKRVEQCQFSFFMISESISIWRTTCV